MDIDTVEKLREFIASDTKVKYLFFWGHSQKGYVITKSCFSQWYECPFEIDGVVYRTAEQYMRVRPDFDVGRKVIKFLLYKVFINP